MDLLELPATPARTRAAVEAAGAAPSAVRHALALAGVSPSAAEWSKFLNQALLLLGAGLLLSDIVCFFACNWADPGRFADILGRRALPAGRITGLGARRTCTTGC